MDIRVISLFAGIGGFDLGFDRAGFKIVAHVEKDANCRKLLAEKWPDAVALDDVCTAGKYNLPECDVITFGFPCQDLSVAGKRAGLKGKRSGLFYEATRIIRELKPAWALFENVPGLLSSGNGADFAAVLSEMGECGYNGAWRCLDAQWFGVAQRRRRIFGLFTRLDSGAERCAEILSIESSLQGHPAPSREAGKIAPTIPASGVGTGRTGNERTELDFCIPDVAPCLAASGRGTERAGETRGQDCVIPTVARTVSCNTGRGGIPSSDGLDGALVPDVCGCLSDGAHKGGGLNGQDAYTGRIIPTVAGCLQERDAKGADSDTKPKHLVPCYGIDEERNASDNFMGCLKARMESGGFQGAVAFGGDVARTLNARHNSSPCVDRGMDVVATAMHVRRLTPTECERLQGFPDGWTADFADSTRYKMLGNAVCVNVSEWMAKRLKKYLEMLNVQNQYQQSVSGQENQHE